MDDKGVPVSEAYESEHGRERKVMASCITSAVTPDALQHAMLLRRSGTHVECGAMGPVSAKQRFTLPRARMRAFFDVAGLRRRGARDDNKYFSPLPNERLH